MSASTLKKWMLPVAVFATLVVTASYSAIVLAAPTFTGCGGEIIEPTNLDLEQQVIELVNAVRLDEGLPPLKHSPELANSARYHATDMQQDGYRDHDTYDVGEDGIVLACHWYERLQAYFAITQAAENIAMGHRTPGQVVDNWLSSPLHRDNLLSDNWETGVGFFNYYWVQDLSRRHDVYPLVINREAASTDSPDVELYLYGEWDEIRLRNDGGEWSGWQPFSHQVDWRLNAIAGQRLVEAEVRAGPKSAMSSDTIELNTDDASTPMATPEITPPVELPPSPVDGVRIEGRVQFEGRPAPPNDQWIVPLNVKLIPRNPAGEDEPVLTFMPTTSGTGVFTLDDIAPGAYDLVIKGAHTLQKIIPVVAEAETVAVDVGVLSEGDAVEDNLVNILDFSLMTSVFGACQGSDTFVANADLDMDGCVGEQDFGLLRNNFGASGNTLDDLSAAAAPAAPVGIAIAGKPSGAKFTAGISVKDVLTGVPDAGAIYVNFDPHVLKAVSVAPNAAFSVELQNIIDNQQGRVDFAAGVLGGNLETPFVFASITFEVLQNFEQTEISFETTGMRRTELAQHGVSLLSGVPNDGNLAIEIEELTLSSTTFLPIIDR